MVFYLNACIFKSVKPGLATFCYWQRIVNGSDLRLATNCEWQ